MHCLEVIIKRNKEAAPVIYDFVFIERDGGSPYRVRYMDGFHWLCSLHPDKHWTLKRPICLVEVEAYSKHAIKREYAHLYEFGTPFEDTWPDHQQ